MQRQTTATNNARLLDLLPEPGSSGFGQAMLRLAHMAAAEHRAQAAADADPWEGLSVVDLDTIDLDSKDKAEHGCPAQTRSARDLGPVTTEGDR